MIAILRYTLITALRDWLFMGLLALILLALFVSSFLGDTALSEQNQMTLSYMAGSVRLILVSGLVLFVCFHVRRSFDNKEIEVMLSKPISRDLFIVSYWLAFTVLALVITAPVIVLIALFTDPNGLGLIYWSTTVMIEAVMMVAFAFMSSLIMRSAVTSAMSSLGFYFMSRMMGFFVATIYNKPAMAHFSWDNSHNWLIEKIIISISVFMPRLDLFGKTSWLIHGVNNFQDWVIFPIQALVYVPLLLFAAMYDLKRKQF